MNNLLKIWSEIVANKMDSANYEEKVKIIRESLQEAYELGQGDPKTTYPDKEYPIIDITKNSQ